MPTLIERRHQRTRADIAEAAVALFLERGFDETTMDDLAAAAGVSRRTAYRHFPSKDDLVFEQPRSWLGHFDAEVARPVPGETVRQRCRRGLLAVAERIRANSDSVRSAFAVYVATPSLRGANGRLQDEWYQRLVELLTPSHRLSAARRLELATVAGALVGTTTMLVAVWAASQPNSDIVAMTKAALDQLDPIWPDWLDAPAR
jgi:AcrR family transcriptional regulator